MSTPLTREERDHLLARAADLEQRLYPTGEDDAGPTGATRVKLLDTYYQVLHEYGDRLPRIPVSRCPHTRQIVKRALDPFCLDGPFWHKSRVVRIEEPAAPPTLRVLLGSLDLHGRAPAEVRAEVIPGPEAPFVVPRLLRLPDMRAVISRMTLPSGDTVHFIAYFTGAAIPMQFMHQEWLRQDLWYPNESGGTSWLTKNDPHDFDLAPWIASGQVSWIEPDDVELRLQDATLGTSCPFVGYPGDPHPQMLSGGKHYRLERPDGTPVNPFAEWE